MTSVPTLLPVLDVSRCAAALVSAPLDAVQAAPLALRFKALGDPARLRLLSLIAAHESGTACVCDLIDPLGLSQPTVSHHLRVLREAGLVTSERRGTWVHYSLVPGALEDLSAVLGRGLETNRLRLRGRDGRRPHPSSPPPSDPGR